jgi:hypothetical protein
MSWPSDSAVSPRCQRAILQVWAPDRHSVPGELWTPTAEGSSGGTLRRDQFRRESVARCFWRGWHSDARLRKPFTSHLITLAVTPALRVFGLPQLAQFRRMLVGLFSFFYASVHFLTYLWLDRFFDSSEILADIAKRPFITIRIRQRYANASACANVNGRLDRPTWRAALAKTAPARLF